MKVYKTNEIKNISLVGGKGAGKTTLTESILLEGGTISRRGTVDGGNTVSALLRKSTVTLYHLASSTLRRTARSSTSLTARAVTTSWVMP